MSENTPQKPVFYSELAYLFGVIVLAFGTAMMEKADLGMSMVVAPAYLLHLKLSETLPFFSFGMAEYTVQALLLIALCLILGKFRLSCLLAFGTSIFYGLTLDGFISLAGLLPTGPLAARIAWFLTGMVICSLGVSLLFHTYLPPEAYEMFVKEISSAHGYDLHRFKTFYDLASCLVSILLSFLFFGFLHFEGVKLGTVFCALVNGYTISRFAKLLESRFVFRDRFGWRGFFER